MKNNVDLQLYQLLSMASMACTCVKAKCKSCQAKLELEIIKHQLTAFLESK